MSNKIKNLEKFKVLFQQIHDKVEELAHLYHVDSQNCENAETEYYKETGIPRRVLRRLNDIALGVAIPQMFFLGDSTTYTIMKGMSKDLQMTAYDKPLKVYSLDGSYFSKRFVDLDRRQINMIYDRKAGMFRGMQGQIEWLKANPVERISYGGLLEDAISNAEREAHEKVAQESKKEDKPKVTKDYLIKQLKAIGVKPSDLASLGTVEQLMEAARLALSKSKLTM